MGKKSKILLETTIIIEPKPYIYGHRGSSLTKLSFFMRQPGFNCVCSFLENTFMHLPYVPMLGTKSCCGRYHGFPIYLKMTTL
jgi:hypothetical protein